MVKIGLESLNQLIKISHKCLEILPKAKFEASRAVSSQSKKIPKRTKTRENIVYTTTLSWLFVRDVITAFGHARKAKFRDLFFHWNFLINFTIGLILGFPLACFQDRIVLIQVLFERFPPPAKVSCHKGYVCLL